MVRFISCACVLSFFLLLSAVQPARVEEPPTFYYEIVEPGGSEYPSIDVDIDGTPWIGDWHRAGSQFVGTMHFARREPSGWQIESLPYLIKRPTNIVLDEPGCPGVAYTGANCVMEYTHKSGGVWALDTLDGNCPYPGNVISDNAGDVVVAYIWSYHYLGYINIHDKHYFGLPCPVQFCSAYWFNYQGARMDLAMDATGEAHLVAHPGWDEYYYTHRTYDTWASLEELDFLDGEFAVAGDLLGRAMILHTVAGELRLATKASGTWNITAITDGSANDVVVDINGAIHATFFRDHGDSVTLHYASSNSAAGPWTFQEIDSGVAASLATDQDGNPHIAYICDAGNLKYATTAILTPTQKMSWGKLRKLYQQNNR